MIYFHYCNYFNYFAFWNRKRRSVEPFAKETEDDDEQTPSADSNSSPQSAGKSATVKKINSKSLSILRNGVVSTRDLELSVERPSKSRAPKVKKLLGSSLTRSKAFQFYSLVHFGRNHPMEKARDEAARQLLLRCAAPYAMNEAYMQEFFDSPSEQISAFGIGLARSLQQSMKYALYCVTMNSQAPEQTPVLLTISIN